MYKYAVLVVVVMGKIKLKKHLSEIAVKKMMMMS